MVEHKSSEKKLGHTGGSDCPCELCVRPSKTVTRDQMDRLFGMLDHAPIVARDYIAVRTWIESLRDETTRDDARDAVRYRWLRDWYHREGKRAEIDPYGHIAVRTLPEWEALLDAAIARSSPEEPAALPEPVPCPTCSAYVKAHGGPSQVFHGDGPCPPYFSENGDGLTTLEKNDGM